MKKLILKSIPLSKTIFVYFHIEISISIFVDITKYMLNPQYFTESASMLTSAIPWGIATIVE